MNVWVCSRLLSIHPPFHNSSKNQATVGEMASFISTAVVCLHPLGILLLKPQWFDCLMGFPVWLKLCRSGPLFTYEETSPVFYAWKFLALFIQKCAVLAKNVQVSFHPCGTVIAEWLLIFNSVGYLENKTVYCVRPNIFTKAYFKGKSNCLTC